MATPNPYRVPIVLDRLRHLLFDLNAYTTLEDLTGKNFMTPASWQKISFTDLRVLAYAGLRAEDPTVTLESVGALIHAGNMQSAAETIVKAGVGSMPEQNGNGTVPLANVDGVLVNPTEVLTY